MPVTLDVVVVGHVQVVQGLVAAKLFDLCLVVADLAALVHGHDETRGFALVGAGGMAWLVLVAFAVAFFASILEADVATEVFGEVYG